MQRISEFLKANPKIKELILYVFFGGCTTLVNWVIYFPLTNFMSVHYQVANVIAWICAVIFAYITNKKFVFNSKTTTTSTIAKELVSFFGARIASLLLEMGIMYVTVTLLSINSNVMKIVTAVITVIFNYVASKLVVFKQK